MKTIFTAVPDILLDVVDEPWIVEHSRDIIILSVVAIMALVAIVGIFIWIKNKKKIK